jgi:SAM-dependent methyltransferase
MIIPIRQFIRKQGFNPGYFGLFINPFYFARKGLYVNIHDFAQHIRGRTLDVGCGSKPYEKLFLYSTEYIGLEVNRENKSAEYYYDGKTFPFSDEEFDSVITSQVFEHVFNPDEFLREIHRVLNPGGILLLTTPFVWDEHTQPFDYARYSSYGLMHILNRNGFEIVEMRKSLNDIRVIAQMLNAYIYKKTVSRYAVLNYLTCLVFMAPINIIGTVLGKILPKNKDLYLDNIALARKPMVLLRSGGCHEK